MRSMRLKMGIVSVAAGYKEQGAQTIQDSNKVANEVTTYRLSQYPKQQLGSRSCLQTWQHLWRHRRLIYEPRAKW